jgi:ATP-dependent Clp protease ATP-binding subunit ClpC
MKTRLPLRSHVTERTHKVFALATDLAADRGHDDITGVHVALGILHEGGSVACEVLLRRGVPLDAVARELEEYLPPESRRSSQEPGNEWLPGAEPVLAMAGAEAGEAGHQFVGTEHVLLALLHDEASAPAKVLQRYGIELHDARAEVVRILTATPA